MDATLKAKWVEALRSGKYRQARGCLREHHELEGFCCLGVLIDVQGAQWSGALPRMGDANAAHTEGGWLKEKFAGGLPLNDQKTLARMNDGAVTLKKSFPEIADYIEKNL